MLDRSAHRRLRGELLAGALRRRIEHQPHQAAIHAARAVGIDAGQHAAREIGDLLGFRSFRARDRGRALRLSHADDGDRDADDERGDDERRRRDAEPMPAQERARRIQPARRHRLQRTMVAIAIEILGERDRRVVALVAIRRERAAQHRAKLAGHVADRGEQFAGRVRVEVVVVGAEQRLLQRRAPSGAATDVTRRRFAVGQHFVKHDAERIDVAARIEIARARRELFGTHVDRRAGAIDAAASATAPSRARRAADRDAEVDDLRRRRAVDAAHEHVGGFQIAVDHAFLVRVLHAMADAREQREAFARG